MQLIWESFLKSDYDFEGEEGNDLIVVTYKWDILLKGFKSRCQHISFTRTRSQTENVRRVVGVQGSAF